MPILENSGNTSLESDAREFSSIFIKTNGRAAKLEGLTYAQSKTRTRSGAEENSGWIPIGAETRAGKTTVAIKMTQYPDPEGRAKDISPSYQAIDFDPTSGSIVGIHRTDGGYKTRQQIEEDFRRGGQTPDIELLYFSGSNEKDFLARFDWVISPSSPPSQGQLILDRAYAVSNITNRLLGGDILTSPLSIDVSNTTLSISASSWSGSIKINLAARASNKGDRLDAKQVDIYDPIIAGSVLQGALGNDILQGKAGWDILDGGAGNDLIHAGNGRDILTGGPGSDELWGDLGWNTYKSEKDGASDLIVVKSDQWLVNWINGRAGNNPNGEKCDIIEGLDTADQIRISGCDTKDLTFQANASAHGVSGIGIYAKGALEALYTGGDLTLAQLQSMTTGDGSAAAMNNQIYSYGWTQNPGAFTA